MDMTQILEIFSNPETISTLGRGDLASAILLTLLMGMGTTVVVLTLLMFCTSLMSRIFKTATVEIPTSSAPAAAAAKPSEEDEELAVVLASAVAAMLNTTADRIAVRNIKKV